MLATGWDLHVVRVATEAAHGPGFGAALLAGVARSLSAKWFPFVVLAVLVAYAAWKRTRRSVLAVLAPLAAIGVSDPVNSQIFKRLVHRIRPCHADAAIRTLVHCGPGFSFPSSHAANGAAATCALILALRPRWPGAIVLGAIGLSVGLSRIVVGVHYPTDVLGGWGWGAIAGTLAYLLMRWLVSLMPPGLFRGPGSGYKGERKEPA